MCPDANHTFSWDVVNNVKRENLFFNDIDNTNSTSVYNSHIWTFLPQL